MIRWKVMYIDTKKVRMTQHTHPELHTRKKTLCPVQALYLQVLPFVAFNLIVCMQLKNVFDKIILY